MRCLCRHKKERHKFGRCRERKCRCNNFSCGHWRIKKNYPYGRKSSLLRVCKDCGESVSGKFLEKRKEIKNG